jgi:hypothetical protein
MQTRKTSKAFYDDGIIGLFDGHASPVGKQNDGERRFKSTAANILLKVNIFKTFAYWWIWGPTGFMAERSAFVRGWLPGSKRIATLSSCDWAGWRASRIGSGNGWAV